ncbi:MAG: sigma-54-dependent Fis family transcriptional regulator [Candidatus Binataceae bacterium]|nr:sigma-54-dependent Fis family transcriptional regulator [Candidatus Binataceae bacterium]
MQSADRIFKQSGYESEICDSGDAVLMALKQRGADAIVIGLQLPGMGGLELLQQVKQRRPDVPMILLGVDPNPGTAMAAMRHGAFDYIAKPFTDDELSAVVRRALDMSLLQRENRQLRQQLDMASVAAGFVAESSASKNILSIVRRVAPSRSTVLIEGESGTGKELVARMVHYWGQRAEGPFVAINCKAFADGVMESELFGHEKGSFTGAIAARAGCFERASGGTLFLDEIAETGPDFQAKLLRVLEDGEVLRVGGTKPRKVDVRIVTATNRVLRKEVAANRFRGDLYFRLNVIPIRIPALRERPDDILPLARHFLEFYSSEAGRPITLSPEAERTLCTYSWPGNVRELENVIERAVVMSGAEQLTSEAFALDHSAAEPLEVDDLGQNVNGNGHESVQQGTLQDCLDRAAAVRIKSALESAKGNRALAAHDLGVDRTTLYRLMKRLGLGQ